MDGKVNSLTKRVV